MLQSLRENLKGALAFFILAIFIVPFVFFGVEQLFVGGVGGTDAASVNGAEISKRDFQRELMLEKQRMQQRLNVGPNDARLDDSQLATPVLERMTQREALYQAAIKGGLGASETEVWKQIKKIDAFHKDGQFDAGVFKNRISNYYTPAEFLESSKEDYVLTHFNFGVGQTGFASNFDLELLAALSHQKRTFFTVNIPVGLAKNTQVSESEIDQYFKANEKEFTEPEKISLDYLELSLAKLAEQVSVSDEEILAAYQLEVADFKADPKLKIAHILIEDKNDTKKIETLTAKLAAHEDFTKLAAEYSDDLGSKSTGGELGILTEGAFPKVFVDAAKVLQVGAVSPAVTTDSGVHFIKVLEQTNVTPPTLEERKVEIKKQLALNNADELFVKAKTTLDEKTFGGNSLSLASETLNVPVLSTELFARTGGTGIAGDQKVLEAAFADDVLKDGYNSKVIELADDRALVIRKKELQPEHIKVLADVKAVIEKRLRDQKVAMELQSKAIELIGKVASGESPETTAKAMTYEFKQHDKATRMSFDIDHTVVQKVFSMARPVGDKPIFDQVNLGEKGITVVGLLSLEEGKLGDMEEAQKTGLKQQVLFQLSQVEMAALEKSIVEQADISINK